MKLDDPTIRSYLTGWIQGHNPRGIIEELRIGNGRAIADVVALHNEPHCYEIKGESDKLSRALDQSEHFSRAFRKITLVTTPNHANHAFRIIPSHWGIIICEARDGSVKFRYQRGARNSPSFDVNNALLTLWKSELTSLATDGNKKSNYMNRSDLALSVSSKDSKKTVLRKISSTLEERFRLFHEKSLDMNVT